MIEHKFLRRKQTCALCTKEISKWGSAMYDRAKSVDKRYVHTQCYIDLLKSRDTWKEPPF